VVEAYFAAINTRNWLAVWKLGGQNFGEPFATMVAGYQGTARDDIASLRVNGSMATVHFLAYGTDGTVRSYVLRYLVQGGMITSAHALLVGAKAPVSGPPG